MEIVSGGLLYCNPKPYLRCVPLWQGARLGMTGQAAISDELAGLAFGYPSMRRLPDGCVLAAFRCRQEGAHNIRWLKLAVS